MSMSVGSSSGESEVMVEMNTTPLIDVMLVLLIMLIITIPIQTHAVKLDMPINNPPNPNKPQVVSIDIDFDGSISWNGQAISSRDQLDSMMEQASEQAEQPEVQLRPNKLAEYKYVAEVLADAQRIGLTKIGVVGNEQFVGD